MSKPVFLTDVERLRREKKKKRSSVKGNYLSKYNILK